MPNDPFRVISEIFQSNHLQDLRDNLLPKWLRTAIINENSIYTEASHRTQLLHLYDHLLTLTEALYVIHVQQRITDNESITPDSGEIEKPILLTEVQLANPMEVIAAFRQRFSPEYTRRELWHFWKPASTFRRLPYRLFSWLCIDVLRLYDLPHRGGLSYLKNKGHGYHSSMPSQPAMVTIAEFL